MSHHVQPDLPAATRLPYSDYLVYVDESGDHSVSAVNPEYPIFVLAFCLFRKDEYVAQTCPAIQRFKLTRFGHDLIVLHEQEIVRQTGPFRMLVNADRRTAFFAELNALMAVAPVTVIAIAVDKRALPVTAGHIYHFAMACGLDRISCFLRQHGRAQALTHVICEGRGKTEDIILAQEFQRITQIPARKNDQVPLELVICPKLAHTAGLQIADLVARPIGRHMLNPGQPNRAYEILQEKLWQSPTGTTDDWGFTRISSSSAGL